MEERRKWRRYPIPYPAEKRGEERLTSLTVLNVSKGGVCFTTSENLHKDDTLSVNLFLKNKMFNMKADVVYIAPVAKDTVEVGAKFTDVPEGFVPVLEKEIEEITSLHRESNLYKHKNLSFEKASLEYLQNNPLTSD